MAGFIYKITRAGSNNQYIGSSSGSLPRRLEFHFQSVREGSTSRLHTWMRECMVEGEAPFGFVIEVVCRVEFLPEQDKAARGLTLRMREQVELERAQADQAWVTLNQQRAWASPEVKQARRDLWYSANKDTHAPHVRQAAAQKKWDAQVDAMLAAPSMLYRCWFDVEFRFNIAEGMDRAAVLAEIDRVLVDAPANKRSFIVGKAVRLSTRADLVRAA